MRSWQAVMGDVVGAPARSAEPTTPMGLQFEVRELTPRTHDRWRGPTSKTATPPTVDSAESSGAGSAGGAESAGGVDGTGGGGAAESAGGGGAGSVPSRRLGVRPVVRVGAGGFVKANVTWGSFTHQVNRLNLDPEHHRWFAQFAALHRATRTGLTAPETDWLALDDFTSPLLWQLLDEARRLGIALVTSAKGGTVEVTAGATVGLDARRGPDGALTLDPVVAFWHRDRAVGDGPTPFLPVEAASHAAAASPATATAPGAAPTPGPATAAAAAAAAATGAGATGTHGIYAYRLAKRPTITLGPSASACIPASPSPSASASASANGPLTPAPPTPTQLTPTQLTPEQVALLGRPPVVVPGAETAQFFEEYFPTLRRGVEIASPDGSVEFPEVPPPELLLTARFRGEDLLQLDWEWLGIRDPNAERALVDATVIELDAVLTRFPSTIAPLGPQLDSVTLRGVDAAAFAEKALPMLDALEGVKVEVIGPRPVYRELTGHPDITLTTVETLKRDWFDLGIVVNIGEYRIPFGPLFKALSKGSKKMLMVDRTYLSLDHPAFDRLKELLEEAGTLDEWETGVRIARHQLTLWAEFDDLADESVEAVAWREAVEGLRDVDRVPETPLPEGVRAELRPYQKAGFDWLAFLWRHRLGGVLADDMGLGKTLQTLAFIAHTREQAPDAAPFLVVAPTSVVATWADEAARFTPGLTVRTITATESTGTATGPAGSSTIADTATGADIVVTSYALFRLDAPAYQRTAWSGLVLDEAQFVKNHRSRVHASARDLDVPFTLAVTGTPLENDLLELWALFDLTAPGLFPSPTRFAERFQRPIERGQDARALETLRRRIRPFLLRRTKESVAPELPPRQEQVLPVELAPAHRHLYDTVLQRERQKLFGLIEDLDRNRFIVFRSLTLLRMLSLDASLIDEAHASIPSSKLDVLVQHLTELAAEGHRALVFSQFTSYLAKVADRLDAEGMAHEYLDGSTRRRPEVIARFREGDAPVFLISLKAGGFGLTLTEADYVFLLDPWWNPASEAQAVDRTHRIGQTKPVTVYRLVATGTIEEKVMELKRHKAKLFDAVLDDAGFDAALTADDIRALLA
ncbi:DEAD/DEAH box helicase [Herbiconiux sp. P15]|uniref:DEAD/DEAH box helicase n=1 Tax=Herbiconiux liukaitaii TaxID=3342799 RepID=UPI0035B8AF22